MDVEIDGRFLWPSRSQKNQAQGESARTIDGCDDEAESPPDFHWLPAVRMQLIMQSRCVPTLPPLCRRQSRLAFIMRRAPSCDLES